MKTTTAFKLTETLNGYKIGTFVPTAKQLEIAADAIEIAKQMRVDGDTDTEDFARAMTIIRGSGFHERFKELNYIPEPIEKDRQVAAYMDGVSILMWHHPEPHVPNHSAELITIGGYYTVN